MSSEGDLATLFSPSMTRTFAMGKEPALFRELLEEAGLNKLDEAFKVLAKPGNRNDYVFRSAIVQKLVVGKNKLTTSALLNEFRVRNSRVDIGVADSTLTAYEIKSDRDSFARLHTQLSDYARFFRQCYVVVSEARVKSAIRNVPPWCGVISLTDKFTLRTEKPAEDLLNSNCPEVLCNCLRITEARQVVTALDGSFPDLPNTLQRTYARECFVRADIAELSDTVRTTLIASRKSSTQRAEEVRELPSALRAAYLAAHFNKKQENNYFATLRSIM
ncbi:sce7726 family protein [Corynebacterium glucuronolyticum]|uniref:Sce7726 family protein n=1 Tax=Corynebacterium glucuronolyticum TaxID=39791 RepID=A0A7T4EHE2_9CORY|nr:sce7726 family protein [Corynebacterium glucuronolyticum]QQB47396.1 sce7726 family protein [Corynebacterium glucuronolyticum]WKD64270.1 hypothetical protein CGLUCO_10160 [Corynebacterium glucuronolyticum DSM 44120]SMB78269.1 hypothetical protein SAMN05660745_01886 [Corynebacterium glucuronolyticum]